MINEQHRHPATGDRRPTAKVNMAEGGQWPVCTPDGAGHCITCSDEAIEARIVDIARDMQLATVIADGAAAEVDVSLVDELAIGDRVLVHGGVAIAKL